MTDLEHLNAARERLSAESGRQWAVTLKLWTESERLLADALRSHRTPALSSERETTPAHEAPAE